MAADPATATETLPAGDPTPKAPVEQKVERPNREELDKKCKALDDKIAACQAIIDEMKQNLDNHSKQRESGGDKRSVEQKKLNELKAKTQKVSDARNELFTKLKSFKAQQQRLRDQNDDMRKRLKEINCFSTETVEKKIRELEYYLATNPLNLKEERAVIADIKNLNASKKIIGEFDGMQARKEECDAKLKEISGQLDENKKELDTARAAESKQAGILSDLRKASGGRSEVSGWIEARNAARTEKNKHYDEIKKLRGEFRSKEDAWRKHMNERRKAQQERRKAEMEARKEEDRIRKLEKEEEQLERLHADTFATIEQLTSYLKPFMQTTSSGPKTEEPVAEATIEGMTRIGKKAAGFDEDIFGTRKAGKKSKGKKGKKKPKTMTHDLKLIQEFESLKIDVPLGVDDIPAALDALAKKKTSLEQDKAKKQAARLAKLEAAKNGQTEEAEGADKDAAPAEEAAKDDDKKDEAANDEAAAPAEAEAAEAEPKETEKPAETTEATEAAA